MNSKNKSAGLRSALSAALSHFNKKMQKTPHYVLAACGISIGLSIGYFLCGKVFEGSLFAMAALDLLAENDEDYDDVG